MVCRFSDTTAPTKEGLLWDDKIVSNLHEQISSRGSGNQLNPSVWGAALQRRHVVLRVVLIACASIATQGEYYVRSCRSALSQRCPRRRHRDRVARSHLCGRQSALRPPACFSPPPQ